MDIDPVVWKARTLGYHESHRQKITVMKARASVRNVDWGRRAEGSHQLGHRHGGDDVRSRNLFCPSVGVDNAHGRGAFVLMINSHNAGTKLNSSARSYDEIATALPHHARTKLRILELLDQTCDLCLIALWKECIDNGVAERQSFDSLRCPVGGHVLDWNSPDFFRIRLEKSSVEPPSKPSHQPIFIVALILWWSKLRPNVGQHAANRFDHSKIFQSVRCFQWIVVVLPLVEDATHPRA